MTGEWLVENNRVTFPLRLQYIIHGTSCLAAKSCPGGRFALIVVTETDISQIVCRSIHGMVGAVRGNGEQREGQAIGWGLFVFNIPWFFALLHNTWTRSVLVLRRCVWSSLSADWVSTAYGCQSCLWLAEQGKWNFTCPRSRLRVWSRELGSVIPSRVSPLILHTQPESGTYLQDSTPGFRYGFH